MEQESSALVRSDYNSLPREMKKTNDSMSDRIYKYYHSEKTRIELTPEEHKIRERWEKAWLLMCRHRTRKQVAEIVEKLFGVSKSVAYDDIRNAMMLFSDPQDDLKHAKRSIAESMAMQGLDRCWKNGDMDGYWKLLKLYVEMNNLTSEEGNAVGDLLKKLKPQQIVIVANPDELKDMARQIQNELAEDIDFQAVK